MSETREQTAERIRAVADLLGLSPEQLVVAAANAGNAIEALEPEEEEQKPPPIVYPNVKYKKYKFQEFPKILYRGYIRDVEEPIIKMIPQDNGSVKQVNAIRVLPDQFVTETMTVKNRIEEMSRPAGWYLTLGEAREAAEKAKLKTRPIVERIVPDKEEDEESDAPAPKRERTVAPRRRKGR